MSGFWSNFFGGRHTTREVDLTKRQPRRPEDIDLTGGEVADSQKLNALYKGTGVNTQFSSAYTFTPINVPTAFVGIPTPKPIDDDQRTADEIKNIIDAHSDDFQIIEKTKLLQGTAWRWVRVDARTNEIVWEAIQDSSIVALGIDIISQQINAVYTHEKFKVMIDDTNSAYVERKRKITKEQITVKYMTNQIKGLEDFTARNPIGTMPIPFGHDCLEGEWRGISIFSRVYRLLRSNHEIKLNREQTLATFRAKMKVRVKTGDLDGWLEANSWKTINDIKPYECDLVIVQGDSDKEDFGFVFLDAAAVEQHTKAIADNNADIIIGTGLPEVFWPPTAKGNHASTDIQMNQGMQYIQDLRREDDHAYSRLFTDTLSAKAYLELRAFSPIVNSWNNFSMLSEKVKSEVFNNVTSGVSKLVAASSGTFEDVLYFFKQFYPDFPEQDVEKFSEGLMKMAKHVASTKSDVLNDLENGEYADKKGANDANQKEDDEDNQSQDKNP